MLKENEIDNMEKAKELRERVELNVEMEDINNINELITLIKYMDDNNKKLMLQKTIEPAIPLTNMQKFNAKDIAFLQVEVGKNAVIRRSLKSHSVVLDGVRVFAGQA